MKFRIVLATIALASIVPLSGCQKAASVLLPKPEVITREATAAASGAEVQGDIPDGLPEDLPLWPGAIVKKDKTGEGSEGLLLETLEPYEDVVAGVAVGFERAGWKAVELSKEESAAVLEVSKDGYEGVVTVYGNGAGSAIEYLFVTQQ